MINYFILMISLKEKTYNIVLISIIIPHIIWWQLLHLFSQLENIFIFIFF